MLKKLLPLAAFAAVFWSTVPFTGRSSFYQQTLSGRRTQNAVQADSSKTDSINSGMPGWIRFRNVLPDSLRNDSLRTDSLMPDSLGLDSLGLDSLRVDSLRTDSLHADSLLLTDHELDSLQRLSETHYIDTIILATPKVVPPRPNEWTLKTNLLMDLTCSPYFGFSFGLGNHWTLEFEGSYNPFTFSGGRKWKHGMGMVGGRYWTKDREGGHFVGAHALAGTYNINKTYFGFMPIDNTGSHRYEGWGAGGGFSYGYRWNFNESWGMEGEIGVGYVYSRFDKFNCYACAERIESGTYNYVGPTKLSLNLIYRFGRKKREEYKKAIAPRPVPFIRERLVRDTIYQTEIETKIDTLVQKDTVEVEAPVPVVSNKNVTLHIQYKSGSSMLLHDLGNNAKEMNQFLAVLDSMKTNPNITINSIRVSGFASIDGSSSTNMRLSRERAEGVAKYLRSKYTDLQSKITSEGRGEDWDGLLKYIEEAVGLPRKDEAAYILRTAETEAAKESQIRRLDGGRFYQTIYRDIFPKLRRIECQIGFTEIRMQKTRKVKVEDTQTVNIAQ